jgi:group I intron endonuclease
MFDWVPLYKYTELPKISGIYLIRNIDSGRTYVGKSINIRKRARDHYAMKDDTYLARGLRKHGHDRFQVRAYIAAIPEILNSLEVMLIRVMGTYGKLGYNRTLGGEGTPGRIYTDEQRIALGNLKRGHKKSAETIEKIKQSSKVAAASRVGVPRTEEVRAKLRKSAAVRYNPPRGPMRDSWKEAICASLIGVSSGANNPRARSVLVWVPESMVPFSFSTAKEAAKYFSLPKRNVSNWCTGKYKPSNGYVFVYE